MRISKEDALALRMRALLLGRPSDPPVRSAATPDGGPPPVDVAGVVTWFGAMQAQDAASAAWSFGVRVPTLTRATLDAALERKEAIRTWPMRGTVHYVPPRDAHWMLDLMGSRMLAGAAKRRAFIGLSDEVAERALDIFATALAGGKRLTRAQCLDALRDNGIEVDSTHGYHLLWYASQRGITCFSPNIGNEQAFMLLDEWVPDPNRLEREEALATIAIRYFQSHGPTTVADLAGWTGLTVTDCRRATAAAGEALTTVDVDGTVMQVARQLIDDYRPGKHATTWVLPGFDEFMLGFKDRSLMLETRHQQAIIPGGNGVFQPTLVRGGRVIGTWRRTVKPKRVEVTATPFDPAGPRLRTDFERNFEAYGAFHDLPCVVTWA